MFLKTNKISSAHDVVLPLQRVGVGGLQGAALRKAVQLRRLVRRQCQTPGPTMTLSHADYNDIVMLAVVEPQDTLLLLPARQSNLVRIDDRRQKSENPHPSHGPYQGIW